MPCRCSGAPCSFLACTCNLLFAQRRHCLPQRRHLISPVAAVWCTLHFAPRIAIAVASTTHRLPRKHLALSPSPTPSHSTSSTPPPPPPPPLLSRRTTAVTRSFHHPFPPRPRTRQPAGAHDRPPPSAAASRLAARRLPSPPALAVRVWCCECARKATARPP